MGTITESLACTVIQVCASAPGTTVRATMVPRDTAAVSVIGTPSVSGAPAVGIITKLIVCAVPPWHAFALGSPASAVAVQRGADATPACVNGAFAASVVLIYVGSASMAALAVIDGASASSATVVLIEVESASVAYVALVEFGGASAVIVALMGVEGAPLDGEIAFAMSLASGTGVVYVAAGAVATAP